MIVTLPWPNKLLWPNGSRGDPRAVAGQKKRHKAWAWAAAKEAGMPIVGNGKIPIRLIVHAKPKGPLPDGDNCVAALKAYQDGIAQAIGIDDKHFEVPTVEFALPRDGRFVVEIGL